MTDMTPDRVVGSYQPEGFIARLLRGFRQRRWYIYRDFSTGWIVADAPKGTFPDHAVWMPSWEEAMASAQALIKARV